MPLRIGFDMDGVLADFAGAFREVEVRLFGAGPALGAGAPESEPEEKPETQGDKDGEPARSDKKLPKKRQRLAKNRQLTPRESRRRHDAIWDTIRATPNFWAQLRPYDVDAVRRINALAASQKWEVFFITQRPYTDGETVQRQTQRWLQSQGFDLPSVLVISGSRGGAAAALRLDYHVDDSAQNCIDVMSDSGARAILIVQRPDEVTAAQARRLGLAICPSITEALDLLEQASLARTQPKLLDRLASLVGWR